MQGNSQFKQQKLSQYEVRKVNYTHTWKVPLTRTCVHDPCWCLLSLLCPPCVSYELRKRSLYNDMTRYICCNGDCPCSGRMGESSCPEFCLCMEVFFCFGQSVASTRWLLQDEMHIQNTPCDNCIIGTMIFMQQLACICSILACLTQQPIIEDMADIVEAIAHFLWITVCACLQTQHHVQLKERNTNPGIVRPPMNPYMAPAPQAMPPPGHQAPYPPYGPPQAGAYQGGPYQGPPQGYNQQPQMGYPAGQQMQR